MLAFGLGKMPPMIRPTMSRTDRTRLRGGALMAIAVAFVLVLGACSDDDDGTTTTGDTEGTAAPAQADPAAFCEGYADLSPMLAGPPPEGVDPEETFEQVQANAPDEIEGAVETLVTMMREMGEEEGGGTDDTAMEMDEGTDATVDSEATDPADEGGPPPEEFLVASAEVGRYAAENCGDETLTVTAADYEFTGMPSTLAAGEYGIVLENEGVEWHEMLIFKKNEGVEATAQELLDMPEEEALGMVEQKGAAFAGPGESSGTVVDLEEGDYFAVCFIPVGTTSLDTEGDGPPHFTEGMLLEFSVT
jgi:hypothetical protein